MNDFLENVRLVSAWDAVDVCMPSVPTIGCMLHARQLVSARTLARCASCANAVPMLPAVVQGYERVAEISGAVATIESRTPWDGGEGEAFIEDEFSLDDIMGDDDGKDEL